MNLLPFPKEQTSSQQLNDFGLTVPPGGQYVNAFSFFFSSKETEERLHSSFKYLFSFPIPSHFNPFPPFLVHFLLNNLKQFSTHTQLP